MTASGDDFHIKEMLAHTIVVKPTDMVGQVRHTCWSSHSIQTGKGGGGHYSDHRIGKHMDVSWIDDVKMCYISSASGKTGTGGGRPAVNSHYRSTSMCLPVSGVSTRSQRKDSQSSISSHSHQHYRGWRSSSRRWEVADWRSWKVHRREWPAFANLTQVG